MAQPSSLSRTTLRADVPQGIRRLRDGGAIHHLAWEKAVSFAPEVNAHRLIQMLTAVPGLIVRVSDGGVPRSVTPGEGAVAWAAGSALLVQGIEGVFPEVTALAQQAATYFGGKFHRLFGTCMHAGQPGEPKRTDPRERLVLQVEGSTLWKLFDPTWPDVPSWDVKLDAGDVLFIPRLVPALATSPADSFWLTGCMWRQGLRPQDATT